MANNWNNKKTRELFNAFLSLRDTFEVANFCRDLMTEQEIEEFASRFEVAKKLYEGQTQRATASQTGVSIATVTRVNQWLKRGQNGYKLVLDRLHHHP